GGLLNEAVNVASIFIPDGTIVSTAGRSQPRQVYLAKGGAISGSIPVVVLVDHGTASAAEIVTGALQDRGRAKVVGTHTYGKGVFQEIQTLSNGGALDITVGEYFTPSGRNLGGGGVREGAGITPNIPVATNARAAGGGRAGGRAAVARRLGRPDVARDVIGALMIDRGLRRGFDPAVEHEVREMSIAIDLEGRRDLRELPTFTIDPVTARDFDDAISAAALTDGSWTVWVHIADVSAY